MWVEGVSSNFEYPARSVYGRTYFQVCRHIPGCQIGTIDVGSTILHDFTFSIVNVYVFHCFSASGTV